MTDKTPSYLRHGIHDAESVKPKQLREDTPPSPEGDTVERCMAFSASKYYHNLEIRRNGQLNDYMEMSHLSTRSRGNNEVLYVLFGGEDRFLVIIKGLNLLHLMARLKERKVNWISEVAGNAGKFPQFAHNEVFIEAIKIRTVKGDEAVFPNDESIIVTVESPPEK